MSGEGVIPAARIREAIDRLRDRDQQTDRCEFDRRPGDLEATRGLASVAAVVGCRPPYEEHFGVTVFLRPARGAASEVHLTVEEAESLAASLAQMAALCRVPGCVPGERK